MVDGDDTVEFVGGEERSFHMQTVVLFLFEVRINTGVGNDGTSELERSYA